MDNFIRISVITFLSISFSMMFDFNNVLVYVWLGFTLVYFTLYFVFCTINSNFPFDKIISDGIRKRITNNITNSQISMFKWLLITYGAWILSWFCSKNIELFNIGHSLIGNLYIYINVIWVSFILEIYFILLLCVQINGYLRLRKDVIKNKY